jgi:hypothetical protein
MRAFGFAGAVVFFAALLAAGFLAGVFFADVFFDFALSSNFFFMMYPLLFLFVCRQVLVPAFQMAAL